MKSPPYRIYEGPKAVENCRILRHYHVPQAAITQQTRPIDCNGSRTESQATCDGDHAETCATVMIDFVPMMILA